MSLVYIQLLYPICHYYLYKYWKKIPMNFKIPILRSCILVFSAFFSQLAVILETSKHDSENKHAIEYGPRFSFVKDTLTACFV